MWTDRHCPAFESGSFEMGTDPLEVCSAYANDTLTTEQKARVDLLTDSDPFSRENGARMMVSITAEIAIKQRWNIWAQFEGAPFQEERAAYVDEYNGAMFSEDIGTYFRLGSTYKF
jgi:hypothetical protein